MTKSLSLLLFLICCNGYSQSDSISATLTNSNYTEIDTYAKAVRYKNDLKLLAHELTGNYDSELDKVRAIFIWIANNIAYDYKFVNRRKKIKFPKCKKDENCQDVQRKWEDRFLHKTITRKKAICEGYARLFRRLCDYAGIQGNVVSGYTKQEPGLVGKMGRNDHAWNAILLDGKFYYFDVTWAAGYCTHNKKGKLKKFHKRYDDYYWLTPPEKLYRNHFPTDSIWLTDSGYTKERYRDNAYIRGDKMESLDIIEPKSGVVQVKHGDTLRFKIRDTEHNDVIQLNTNLKRNPNLLDVEDWSSKEYEEKLKKQEYIPFKRNGDLLEFEYFIDNKKIRYIEVLFHHSLIMRFNVKVTETE